MVLTNAPLSLQIQLNEWTHANGVHFIAAETRGLFGYVDILVTRFRHALISGTYRSVFNDFGSDFTCVDPTGEQPLTGMVAEIDQVNIEPMSLT